MHGRGLLRGAEPPPAFCEDFDDATPDLDADRWTKLSGDDGGTVVLDTTQATSPPRSMLAFMNPRTGSCLYASALYHHTGVASRHVAIGFQLRIGDGYPGIFGALKLDDPTRASSGCAALFYDDGTHLGFLDQGTTAGTVNYTRTYEAGRTLPRDTWLRFELDYDQGEHRAVIRIDGEVALDATLVDTCPNLPGEGVANVGLYCQDNPGTFRVWYDDVTLDVR